MLVLQICEFACGLLLFFYHKPLNLVSRLVFFVCVLFSRVCVCVCVRACVSAHTNCVFPPWASPFEVCGRSFPFFSCLDRREREWTGVQRHPSTFCPLHCPPSLHRTIRASCSFFFTKHTHYIASCEFSFPFPSSFFTFLLRSHIKRKCIMNI